MSWTKVIDRPAVEILLDDGRTDVRGACNGRSVPEPLAHRPHYGRNGALPLRLGLRDPVLRECDRSDQRPAPGAEVLGREFVAHVLSDVVVQLAAVEVVGLIVEPVAQETPAPVQSAQRLDG